MANKPIVIIGGGPAGYKLALELRKFLTEQEIIIIEKSKLGGTCLHRGCIPSKQLHSLKILEDYPRLLNKNQTLLERGILAELKAAGIELIAAEALIKDSSRIELGHSERSEESLQRRTIEASRIIVATGSKPRKLVAELLPAGAIVHDTDSFFSPENLTRGLAPAYTFIGGGYIGTELASMLASLGIKTRIVEAQPTMLGFLDDFIKTKLLEELTKQKIEINLGVSDLTNLKLAEGEEIIVAIGREPVYPQGYSQDLGLDIIGDAGGKMALAHYAYAEAKLLARVIAGEAKPSLRGTECRSNLHAGGTQGIASPAARNDSRELPTIQRHLVPQVIFTKPEVAMLGYTEAEAKQLYGEVDNIIIPWTLSGKARIEGKERGFTKIVAERGSGKILGVHMIGQGASDLISIAVPIINTGSTIRDLESWIFPHPTIGELFGL